jgi:hypothetical protein
MPGVTRELIEHELHVDPKAKPVKQSLRRFTQHKRDVIKKEIARLLDVGFIQEVYHPDWLANLVLVSKTNKEQRMCIDYTDLNNACQKDPFDLSQIDQVMDSTAGCSLLSSLDCYSGYNQIPLKVKDQIKTNFITLFDAFYYTTMLFGQKSMGATYHRGIEKSPHHQLRRNMEGCIDGVVIKTRESDDLISDLAETFDSLRKFSS